MLDGHKAKEEIVRILMMGAHGYVSHTDAPSPVFVATVRSVLRKDTQARQTTTPREDEILELVRRRLSNREIADLLQIRVSTVKFHLSNILSKMHANNRRELTGPTSQNLWKM